MPDRSSPVRVLVWVLAFSTIVLCLLAMYQQTAIEELVDSAEYSIMIDQALIDQINILHWKLEQLHAQNQALQANYEKQEDLFSAIARSRRAGYRIAEAYLGVQQ